METYVYEVKKPFEYNGRQYQVGEFLFALEGLPQQGIGDIQNGKITNPIPARIYADRIAPYQNWQPEPVVMASSPIEKQTCPRRMSEMGPWEHKPDLDQWRQVGPDRVCSFCCSMHPDDFEKALDRCIAGEDVWIDQSDKSYKVYVHRPEISHAGEGAIKYYKQHNPTNNPADPYFQRMSDKFNQAIAISKRRWTLLANEGRNNQ